MSFTIKHSVTLDLSINAVQATIPFEKADIGAHKIIFRLRNVTEPIALPPGTTAMLMVYNGVGDSGVVDYCTVNHVNNTVEYDATPEALAVAGNIEAALRIVGKYGESVGVSKIIFSVIDTKMDGSEQAVRNALKASTSWGIIQQTEENAKDVNAAKEAAAISATNAAISETNAAISAGEASTSAGEAEKSATSAKGAAKRAEEAVYKIFGKPTEGLGYAISEDGTYFTCTGIGTATDTDIVIASVIDGIPVTRIGDNAFDGKEIASVYIPDGVTRIGFYAFCDCKNLKEVRFPANGVNVASDAFSGSGLVKISIPENSSLGSDAFTGCDDLESVILPKSTSLTGVVFGWSPKCTVYTDAEENIWGDWVASDVSVVYGAALDFLSVNDKLLEVKGVDSVHIDLNRDNYKFKVIVNQGTEKEVVSNEIDLPLESVIVDAEYITGPSSDDSAIRFTLQNGNTFDLYVSSFIHGLVNEDKFNNTVKTLDNRIDALKNGGLVFQESDTNAVLVDGFNAYGNVIIPSSYNGKPVTAIGNNAFLGENQEPNRTISSITIPSTVTHIGTWAFAGCAADWIFLPKGITVEADGLSCKTLYTEETERPDYWHEDQGYRSVVWGAISNDIPSINACLGDVSTALDELHAYAEALVGGDE